MDTGGAQMKWEYQDVMLYDHSWKRNEVADPSLDLKGVSEVLNIMGQDGWELVAVIHVVWTIFYFKRPVMA
jgi:hypothetical protein